MEDKDALMHWGPDACAAKTLEPVFIRLNALSKELETLQHILHKEYHEEWKRESAKRRLDATAHRTEAIRNLEES